MVDLKARLLKEKYELDDKIEKLSSTLNSEKVKVINGEQITLLNVQLKIMESYSRVLLERLVRLKDVD